MVVVKLVLNGPHVKQKPSIKWKPAWVPKLSSYIYCKLITCIQRTEANADTIIKACPNGKCLASNIIIKHRFVTRHADVEVSGQTVKACLIQHRSNYGYKPLSKRGTHASAKHVWFGCPRNEQKQNKASSIKHENKRNVSSTVWWLSSFIKHDKTRSHGTKQGVQTVKCLVTKQCLVTNARNVSFRFSLRWPIHIINPIDKTKLSR